VWTNSLVSDEGTDDLADALDRMLISEATRDCRRERGQQRCQKLSWERTARETLAVYERLLPETGFW